MNKTKLSIVIVNYNTKELIKNCLDSLAKVQDEVNFETIVVDNGSVDGSVELIKESFKWVQIVETGENLGFAKGNNKAKNLVKGEYVLFLNSDTIVHPETLKKTINYIDNNSKVGAISCKIVLPSGELDRDVRRSFPTPWVAFTHFSGLDKIFPRSKLFAKYWYGYKDENLTYDVDVLQGAFCMVRKNLLDQIGWFDEAYFLDGEDIDLCWKIKEKDYLLVYYPEVSITHIKGATKGKNTGHNRSLTSEERRKFVTSGVGSMEIFYKKRLWSRYPLILSLCVILGIRMLKLIRILKI